LVKTKYADFGPTLATEVLLDKHELRVGRETLRRWMMAEGLWLSRTQRRTFHQPRLRREGYGELIQIDGGQRATVKLHSVARRGVHSMRCPGAASLGMNLSYRRFDDAGF